MDPRRRDGLLAVAGFAALTATAFATVGGDPLLDPAAVAVGVAGAVLIEVAFLRFPERLLGLWERRGVPVASLLVVLLAGAAAAQYEPATVGALVWGLGTYLALLGCVLAGLGNPVALVARPDDGE